MWVLNFDSREEFTLLSIIFSMAFNKFDGIVPVPSRAAVNNYAGKVEFTPIKLIFEVARINQTPAS